MRYFIELAFHGKNYHGWQVQPDVRTVQGVLIDALSKLLGTSTDVVGAGRTDTGVHARQMYAHFDSMDVIHPVWLKNKLNAFLPPDIVVYQIFEVPEDAHARFDARSRSYAYHVYLGRNPFGIDTSWQLYNQVIDINKMNDCAALLLEYTNFKCFSKVKTDVRTYNCKVTEAKWVLNGEELVFVISADRFLRNMVRAIVGTLLDVGTGKKSIKDFMEILKSQDRRQAGLSVPAKGLFLTQVNYPENLLKNKLCVPK
ncbi:tRNA pseudouridine(38-40) synthase TruA [Flavobacteriaceae bacterium F08102]|nr:tRNA pseudouridine(38-40) synthase TruA [Flavobacteriaceae bacterium F08102]